MSTSVPQVRSINELKLELAKTLELAQSYGRDTRDWAPFARTVALARRIYEQEMKPAAHKGYLDWNYMAIVGASLERVEAIAARRAPSAVME